MTDVVVEAASDIAEHPEHYLPRPLYDVEPVRSLIEQGKSIVFIKIGRAHV